MLKTGEIKGCKTHNLVSGLQITRLLFQRTKGPNVQGTGLEIELEEARHCLITTIRTLN